MIELLLTLLPVLLPLLIPLLKKDAQQRKEALEMARIMRVSAMKTGDWQGVFMGGMIERVASFDDDQQASFITDLQSLQAAATEYQAAKAAKEKDGDA